MGKQKHFNSQQLITLTQVQKIIDDEVRKRTEVFVLADAVREGIRAAHKIDVILSLIVLLDHYGADKEWIEEYLTVWRELLMQYNDGTVEIRQMIGHIEVRTGINVLSYIDSNMDLTQIRKENDEENNSADCHDSSDGIDINGTNNSGCKS